VAAFLAGFLRLATRGRDAESADGLVTDRETRARSTHPWTRLMTGAMWRRVVKTPCGLNHNILCHLPPLVIYDDSAEREPRVLGDTAVAVRA